MRHKAKTCLFCGKELDPDQAYYYDAMLLCGDCFAERFGQPCFECGKKTTLEIAEPVGRAGRLAWLCPTCFERSPEKLLDYRGREIARLRELTGVKTLCADEVFGAGEKRSKKNHKRRIDLIEAETVEIIYGCGLLTGQGFYQSCKQIAICFPYMLTQREVNLIMGYGRRYGRKMAFEPSTRRPGYYVITHLDGDQVGQGRE